MAGYMCEKEHGVSRRSPVGSDLRAAFAGSVCREKTEDMPAPLGHRVSFLTPSSRLPEQNKNDLVLDSSWSRFGQISAIRLPRSNVVNLRLCWCVPEF